jgi:hypothetical protein
MREYRSNRGTVNHYPILKPLISVTHFSIISKLYAQSRSPRYAASPRSKTVSGEFIAGHFHKFIVRNSQYLKADDCVPLSTTMASVTLLHPEETFTISALQAMTKCSLFQNNPALLVSPYRVQSSVSLSIFREFFSALEGNAINITDTNFRELLRLCDEFGFSELAAKLSEFRSSMDFKETEDVDARGRIAGLEETANQHSHVIAMLQDKVTQLSTDFGRLVGEVSALRSASAGIQTLSEEVLALKAQIAAISSAVSSSQNLPPPPSPPVPLFDSRIISDFPEIFAEFRKKQFSLLWRGSRDGFKAKEFHSRCDGHSNILTVILDTEGNIFGGFTPLEWESREWNGQHGKENNTLKTDDSLRSFLFTLKNPRNIPAKRFALREEKKQWAAVCTAGKGPDFYDITISDNCNVNTRSFTYLGVVYTNDTGLDSDIVFTGSQYFQVEEVEVFEIRD